MAYSSRNPNADSLLLTDVTLGQYILGQSTGSTSLYSNGTRLWVTSSTNQVAPVYPLQGRNYYSMFLDMSYSPVNFPEFNLTATGNRTSSYLTPWAWGTSQASSAVFNYVTSSPLRGPAEIQFQLTGAAGAQFVETPMTRVDVGDTSRILYFGFECKNSGTFANGDMDVVVIRYNSSNVYQATITPSITAVPTGYTQFVASFTASASATDQYAIRIRSQNASARILRLTSLYMGPSPPDCSSTPINASYTSTDGPQTTSSIAVFKYNTKTYDTHTAYDTSTGLYTVPTPGKYEVSALLTIVATAMTASQFMSIQLYKNGSLHSDMGFMAGGATLNYRVWGTSSAQCVAGDTLAIWISTSVTTNALSTTGFSHLEIKRIEG